MKPVAILPASGTPPALVEKARLAGYRLATGLHGPMAEADTRTAVLGFLAGLKRAGQVLTEHEAERLASAYREGISRASWRHAAGGVR